jgi:hypothetical protein
MKSLDEFLKSINPYAPGCAIPTAYFGIRQAAIEFCERSRLWRYDDEFTITADESEAISTPYGAELLDIETASFDGGAPLEPKTTAWLDDHHPGWRTGAVTGKPQYLTQIDMNTLRLVPGQAGTVNISVWLKPSQDCDELPDFLADQYRETIAWGALGRILMTPNQPYTNGTLATGFLAAFEQKLVGLSHKGTTGQQRARVRTKANFL